MPAPVPPRPRPIVASVAVVVSDRARSRRWYTQCLGLEVLEEVEHWLTVGQPDRGGRIHLCLGRELGAGFPLEPGNTGITLSVPGAARETYERLRSQGVPFRRPPEPRPRGWDAEVSDPDGNLLLLAAEEPETPPAPARLDSRGLLSRPPRPVPKA